MKNERSKGVTAFGILTTLISGLLLICFASIGYLPTPSSYPLDILFSLFFFSTVATFVIGIGIFLLKAWSRLLILFVMPCWIILFYLSYFCRPMTGPYWRSQYSDLSVAIMEETKFIYGCLKDSSFVPLSLNLIIGGLIVYFFTRPKVKEQFK